MNAITENTTLANDGQAIYDYEQLTKSHLVKLAIFCGYKADWARTEKNTVINFLHCASADDQLKALLHIGATDEDLENLKLDVAPTVATAPTPTPTPKAQSANVAPIAPIASADTAPDVTQLATLFSQLIAAKPAQVIDEKMVESIVDAKLKNIPARQINVTSNSGTFEVSGLQHKQFEQLLKICSATDYNGAHTLNVWMTGLPGTGKTTAAKNAAVALGLNFFTNGSIANKYELTGFIDAHGKYQGTPFRDAWQNGGVYLFDEIDGSVPSAVLAFNAALANGVFAFPDGMISRNKNCVIIAAANTHGQGATSELVGRAKQDAAFLDRFIFLAWELDSKLEGELCANKEWATYVQKVRAKCAERGLKTMITPRATVYGEQLLRAGIPLDEVKQMVVKKGLTTEQWNSIN